MSGDLVELEKLTAEFKRSRAFASMLWQKWPQKTDWPAKLNLYEAAAYLRVDYKTLWRACKVARTDKRAALAHQRIGSDYRIDRDDLDNFGRVEARAA